MVKKPALGSEIPKRKQHSRYFREELFEFLDDVRRDLNEDALAIGKEFDPRTDFYDESTQGLVELFARSGLDIAAPGHWQFMLIAVLNAYGKNWTRITRDWPESDKNQFLRDLLQLRAKHPDKTRAELCQALKDEKKEDYPADAESLRVQLQKILKEKVERRDAGIASEEDLILLKAWGR